jgi:hypothetical protein
MFFPVKEKLGGVFQPKSRIVQLRSKSEKEATEIESA